MTLKDNLMEELQKLRVSREKPKVLQQKDWAKAKKAKTDKTKQLAMELLAEVEGGETE